MTHFPEKPWRLRLEDHIDFDPALPGCGFERLDDAKLFRARQVTGEGHIEVRRGVHPTIGIRPEREYPDAVTPCDLPNTAHQCVQRLLSGLDLLLLYAFPDLHIWLPSTGSIK